MFYSDSVVIGSSAGYSYTMYPLESNNSDRYDPSCPVTPYMIAFHLNILLLSLRVPWYFSNMVS